MFTRNPYALAIFPAILFSIAALVLHTAQHARDREHFIADQARLASTAIDMQLERLLNLTNFCATAPAITDRWDTESFRENCARQAELFQGWVVVVALGDIHRQIFNSRHDAPRILPSYPREEEYKTLRSVEVSSRISGMPRIADVFEGRVFSSGIVTAGQWARLSDGSEAMIYVSMSASSLSKQLTRLSGQSELIFALVDPSLRIVGRSKDLERFIFTPAPDWFLPALKLGLPGSALTAAGPTGIGGTWDAGFHPIPRAPGWMAIAVRPTSESFEFWRLLSINTGLVLIGLLTSAGLTWFLAYRDRLSAKLALAKQAQLHAEQQNRDKSKLLAAFAHDVRTPLVSLIGALALLVDKNKESSSEVNSARYSAEALLQLVDDILELSFLGSGQFTLNNSPVDVRRLAQDLLDQISPSARNKGLSLHLDVSAGLPAAIDLDRLRLQQLLSNLLTNAVKYTDKGAITLTIDCRSASTGKVELTFSIKDTGYGIETSQRERIFQEFGRLDRSIEKREPGTGLGLAICRRILRAMESELVLESDPGLGSTFSFTIVAAVSVQSSVDADAALLADVRILYVEDEPVIRRVTAKQLRDAGATVVEAEEGRKALESLANFTPDLMLVDLQMPDMDGVELIARVCHDMPERPFPIFVLTSHISGPKAAEARIAGADVVFTKPVQILPLAAALKARRGDGGRHTPSIGGAAPFSEISPLIASNFLLHIKSDKESLRNIYLPEFEQSLRSDIDAIRPLIAEGKATEVARISHRALGVCQVLGANGLGDALQKLEATAEMGDLELMASIHGALPFLLTETLSHMNAMLD